ncbi:MAG: discoidin domain-containing protein [bacterium]|nr:discoidin domain-containing protein [bacterium]
MRVRSLFLSVAVAVFCLLLSTFKGEAADNLAFYKPWLASSSEDGERYAGHNALDGNMQTRWSTADKEDPQWLRIDFQAQTEFNHIVVYWETAYADQYRLEVSNDGVDWTTIYSTVSGDGGTDDITFDPVTARYLRLYGVHRFYPQYGYSVWELQVFREVAPDPLVVSTSSPLTAGQVDSAYSQVLSATGGTTPYTWAPAAGSSLPAGLSLSADGTISGTPTQSGSYDFTVTVTDAANPALSADKQFSMVIDPAPPIPPANLALNKLITSSSAEDAVIIASNANDGDPSTRWGSVEKVDPQWLKVDLGQVYGINRVLINWEGAYADQYRIEISQNDVDWQTAYSTMFGDGGTDDVTFSTVNARYVRIYGTHRYDWRYGYSIFEMEVYGGDPLPAETLAVTSASLTDGYINTPYSETLTAAGGTFPYTWSVFQGSLPEGMALSADGVLSGTPVQSGSYDFTVRATDAADPAQTADKQFNLLISANPPNLALHKAIMATSSEDPQTVASKANDGDPSTRWASVDKSDPQWLRIDLGQKRTINHVILKWEAAYADQYRIEVSVDGLNWQTVYSTADGDGGTDDITFNSVNARYVRMYGTHRYYSSYGYSVWEMEVYGTDQTVPDPLSITTNSLQGAVIDTAYSQTLAVTGGTTPYAWSVVESSSLPSGLTLSADGVLSGTPVQAGSYDFTVRVTDAANPAQSAEKQLNLVVSPTPPAVNIAWRKIAVASSLEDYIMTASRAVDGDPLTRWASVGKVDPQWITIDLGQAYDIDHVILRWEDACADAYEIQISSDNESWQTVYSTAAGDGGIDDITFTSANARYVRMYGTHRANERYGYSLWEFEVFETITP